MRNSLEIDQCKTSGYVVRVMREGAFGYDEEEYAFEGTLDVLAEVMRWLGLGKQIVQVMSLLVHSEETD